MVRFRRGYGLLLILMLSVIGHVLLQCQALVYSMLCRSCRCRLLLLLLAFNLRRRALEFVADGILVWGHCASRYLMIMLIHLLLIATVGKISGT